MLSTAGNVGHSGVLLARWRYRRLRKAEEEK
jgi:hypothetical protein